MGCWWMLVSLVSCFIYLYSSLFGLIPPARRCERSEASGFARRRLVWLLRWISGQNPRQNGDDLGQWEFQDPKMEVLYHIRPYFVGIFPDIGYIGLIYCRYLQFRFLKWPLIGDAFWNWVNPTMIRIRPPEGLSNITRIHRLIFRMGYYEN